MEATTPGVDSEDSDAQSELRHLTKNEFNDLDQPRRGEKTQKILEDANDRDEEATARDAVAEERERAADLNAFTDVNSTYPEHGERRAAAHDRADSKTDRESSAEDRIHLSEEDH